MPVLKAHISATEARTLCGLPADGPRILELPWTEWLKAYEREPMGVCPRCRSIARRSADRYLSLRALENARPRPGDGTH